MKKQRILAAMVLVCSTLAFAQDRVVDHNAHGWYSYFGDHPIGDSKWGLHLEGQFRRHDVIQKWQQLLLRPAVNYQVNRFLTLTAGYAHVRTHSYGDFTAPVSSFPEHRLWEQAWWRYQAAGLKWGTRIRFENRFIGSPSGSAFRFENRLRVLQQATKPVSPHTYLTAYNEAWWYVKPYVSSSAFDQNRAYAAIGFNLGDSLRVETGYMNQLLLRRTGAVLESNHTFVFSIFSTAPLFGRQ